MRAYATNSIGTTYGNKVSSTTTGCTNNLSIYRCVTGDTFTAANTYNNIVGDVIEFRLGTPGSGAIYCGTVLEVDVISLNDASVVNGIDRESCNDVIHCVQ